MHRLGVNFRIAYSSAALLTQFALHLQVSANEGRAMRLTVWKHK
eukprot:SAG31_NODE_16422_length_710_cov_0.754501_1_plen_43_part_01